jgi:hypothetical protein
MTKTRALLLLLLIAFAVPAVRAEPAAIETTITGRFVEEDGQPVLELWGTPRERGYAQGHLLGDRIMSGLSADFGIVFQGRAALYETMRRMFVPKFAYSADERAELEGMLEGLRARLPADERRIESLGREIDLIDLQALNAFGDLYAFACSSIALWGESTEDGTPAVVRNFDFPGFELVLAHHHVVISRAGEGRRGWVGVGFPGAIGVTTGMSSDGVFAAIHDVPARSTPFTALRPNVPRLVAIRRLLETVPAENAIEVATGALRSWPTLYGNNILVAAPDPGEGRPVAAVFEYDHRADEESGVTVRTADGESGLLSGIACTNAYHERPAEAGMRRGECWRYERLHDVISRGAPAEPLSIAELFRIGSSVALPREGTAQQPMSSPSAGRARFGTLHQVVGLTGPRTMHVKLGRAGANVRDVPSRTYDVRARARRSPAVPP